MDLAIDQCEIEDIVEEFLAAWRDRDASTCHGLLGPQYREKCSQRDIDSMITNVNVEDLDWTSCGGLKPDADPFDVSVTCLSSNNICPIEFRFGIKRSPLKPSSLCISSLVCKPALHVEQATRAFLEMWRMGNTADMLSMMAPSLRDTQSREQLLRNMAKMGKLQAVGLPGDNNRAQRRENVEFDNSPYHVSVSVRSEDRRNTFRLGFANLGKKSFPAASLERLTYFDDRPAPNADAEELPESKLKGAFTLLNAGKAGDGRGWVTGSDQVEGGFGNGRFIEAQWGNKDLSTMSDAQLEIYQENIDEMAQSPDDMLGDEVKLGVDVGNTLREIPRFKLEPTSIRRRLTDSCCLAFLVAFYVCVIALADYAGKNGNPKRLLFGVDTLGNTCGDVNKHNSGGFGVDLSRKEYLWWPDPASDPKYMLCVEKCPGPADVNSTVIVDYMVVAQDHTASATKYTVLRSTSPVLNRCLPDSQKSGEAELKIGRDMLVLGDLATGLSTIMTAAGLTFVVGTVWLYAISRHAENVVRGTVCGTGLVTLVIIVGLYLVAFPTAEIEKEVTDTTASDTTMVMVAVVLIISSTSFYSFFSKRKLAKYAWPVMGEMSHAVKQIGSGFFVYPVVNFGLLCLLGWGTSLLIVQVLSVGKVQQMCTCAKNTLVHCKCVQSFEFDPGMRWCAAFLLFGMVWNMNILLELTRCTTSGTLSVWFFTDEEEDGMRRMPLFPTFTMFSRIFWNHMGTIAYVAFIRPFHAVQAPIMDCLDSCRRRQGRADQGEFRRKCLGLFLLRCCCWNSMRYVDCDAAIVQVALHGHHFKAASRIGSQLWMRNKRRVTGMQSFILLSVRFGTFFIFGAGMGAAVLVSKQLGTTSPVAVLAMAVLVVYSVARGFTIMYSMVTKSFMLNFLEDGERNGMDEEYYEEANPRVAGGKICHPYKPASQKKMFMPKALQALLERFSFLLDGGSSPSTTDIWDTIAQPANKLTLVHSNKNCRLMRRSHVAQTEDAKFWDSDKKWRVSALIPYRHETQPAGHVRVYVKEPTKTTGWCGFFRTGGLRELERVPQEDRIVKGPYNFEYEVENQKGNHPHFTPEQQKGRKLSRISILVETTSVRCGIRLMKKSEAGDLMDDRTRVRPVTKLSSAERKENLELDSFNPGPNFLSWIEFYELKWDKKKMTDYQFAAHCYQTFQMHFYYYAHKDHGPGSLEELAAGDTAVCGTSNFFYVSVLRYFGIPARCIAGHWLTGNEDNTRVVKFKIGGEKLAIDFSDHCQSEFYAEGLGWVHSDCTAKRMAMDFDRETRQARQKRGRKAWDKTWMKECLSGTFGETNAMLLLGGNGTPSIVNVETETMSREHESTEINAMEGRFMKDLEKAMATYPNMPKCTPESLYCK